MLGPDGDLILCCLNRFSVLPSLLMIYQSSLLENVVEKDVQDDVMPGIDLTAHSLAAAHGVLRVERKPSLAAPTSCLSLLFGNHFFPLSNKKEVLLNLTYHFQGLGGCNSVSATSS